MARKPKKKEEDVEAYRHEAETRKNAVPVGLASYETAKPKPKEYEYAGEKEGHIPIISHKEVCRRKRGTHPNYQS